MLLRSYQQSIYEQVTATDDSVLVQLDTGAGKTPIIAKLAEHYPHTAIVCHRNILIKQASEKLAMCGVTHHIIGSNQTKRICAANNIAKTGNNHLSPKSSTILVSIDSFISAKKRGQQLIDPRQNWVILIDEAHHFAEENKWSSIQETLSSRAVGFTATPCRGDGQPMLKQYAGFFDRIIQAEGYSENGTERLIGEGFLADYECYYYRRETADDLSNVLDVSDNTDDNSKNKIGLGAECIKVLTQFSGDKQTIIIEPRIANADETCAAVNEAGYHAAVIHSELPQIEIERVLQAFDDKSIQCLLAVDMISEGFDVPDADVLILNRKISSFGLYRQLCGRVLRPRKGKLATIVDTHGHAVARHGLPSDPVDWNKRQGLVKRTDLTACAACGHLFKAVKDCCPSCGEINDIDKRGNSNREALEKYIYTSKQVHAARRRIEREETARLQREQREIEAEKATREYFEFSASFPAGIVGTRCKYFYNTAKAVLKTTLSPAEYNSFFKSHNFRMGNLEFYAGILDGQFEKNKEAQIKRLYKHYK